MEELQPCGIGEVGVVRMGVEEIIRVRSVLEGEIGRKVPEATLNLGQQERQRVRLGYCIIP